MLQLQIQHDGSRNGQPKCRGKMALYGNDCGEVDTEESCTHLHTVISVKNRKFKFKAW